MQLTACFWLRCRPFQHSVVRVVGRSVVQKRRQMEAGWRTYIEEVSLCNSLSLCPTRAKRPPMTLCACDCGGLQLSSNSMVLNLASLICCHGDAFWISTLDKRNLDMAQQHL